MLTRPDAVRVCASGITFARNTPQAVGNAREGRRELDERQLYSH